MRPSGKPSVWRATIAVVTSALVYHVVLFAALMWIVIAEFGFAVWDMRRSGESDAAFIAAAIALGGTGAILLAAKLERWVFGIPTPKSGLRPVHTRTAVAVLTMGVTFVGPWTFREFHFQKRMYLAAAGATEQERADALHTLGLIRNPRAIPRLRESLWLEGPEGESAAGALAKVPGGEDALLDVIRDAPEFSPMWTKAALRLREVYETETRARPVVRKLALEHPDPSVRREVVRLFPSRPEGEPAEVLGEAMQDEDGWVRWEAISRTANMRGTSDSRLRAAKSLLLESDPELRRRGTVVLGYFSRPERNEKLVRLLRARLDDEDAGVRMAAVQALKKHAPDDALRVAISVVSDSEATDEQRGRAILFLRDVPDERVDSFLQQLIQDESTPSAVRERASGVLKVRERRR